MATLLLGYSFTSSTGIFMTVLTGRVALVTGSTSGIGLALARRFAAAGAQLVLNGLASRDEADALCEAFEAEYGLRPSFTACDLRDFVQIEQMIADLNVRYGALDILVNN